MKTHVEFRSTAFPPYDGEDDEINPGRYGKRIAELLVRELKQEGFQPLEPIADGWGWVVPITNEHFPLWIGCGNNDEHSDGFLCFIEPHRPTLRRFPFLRMIDTTAWVTAVQQAIDEVLSAEPAITNKHWWSYDEFNNPGRLTRRCAPRRICCR